MMRRSTGILAGLVVGAVAALAAPASAQVNEVSFQGRLTNSSGSPITASTTITFRLYANVTDLVANALWTDSFTVTPNSNGVYAVRLGTNVAFPGTVTWGAQYFLGVQISGETNEMTPRYAIGSSPYAMRAWRLGGLTDTGLAALTTVTDAALGTLTAGASSSANLLHGHTTLIGFTGSVGNLNTLTNTGNADALHAHAFGALTGTGNVALLTANQTFSGNNTFSGNVILPATGITGAGSGSGLNADQLDGVDAAGFLRANASSGVLTGNTLTINAGATFSLAGTWQIGGTAVTATAAELNKLAGTNASVSAANLNTLTGGGGTNLHTHTLAVGATDVTVTAALLNQLTGSSANVTGANLSALTGTGATNLHTHFGFAWSGTNAGAAGLSVTNTDTTAASTGLLGSVSATTAVRGVHGRSTGATGTGIGVYGEAASTTAGAAGGFFTNTGGATGVALEIGQGVLRIGGSNTSATVTGTNLNTLTNGSDASALHTHAVGGHTHLLAAGGTDVTVTAALLNQLAGSSANVTGANLSALTGGLSTALHTHSATNIVTGTLPDAQLSANVALLTGAQTFTGAKTFSAAATFSAAPAFTVAGAVPPFSVSSATATTVTNLSADRLDGIDSLAFGQLGAAQTVTGTWTFSTAPAFTAAGAPFSVSSSTLVANLNAAQLGGLASTAYGRLATASTWTAAQTFTDTMLALRNAANTFSTTVNAPSATAARSIAFPDVSGTVITTGNLASITATGTIASGTWQGTPVGVLYGGTGISAAATGDLLYGSAANTWSRLASVATGSVLASQGVGVAPAWVTAASTHNHDALYLNQAASDAWGVTGAAGTLTIGDSTGGADSIGFAAGNTVNFLNAAGTAPFTVVSSTVVTGLNADLLDGADGALYARLAGPQTHTGTHTFSSAPAFTQAAGTAPFTVVSSTLVTGLNADQLDSLDQSDFLRANATSFFTGANTLNIGAAATLNINGALQISGTPVTATAAQLNALVGGAATNLHTHFGLGWTGSAAVPGLSVSNTGSGFGLEGIGATGAGVRGVSTSAPGGDFASTSGTALVAVTTTGALGADIARTGAGVATWGARVANSGAGSSTTYGLEVNTSRIASIGTVYGIRSNVLGANSIDTSNSYGLFTFLDGAVDGGARIGIHNEIASNAVNTTTVWGFENVINAGIGGTTYGIYNLVSASASRTSTNPMYAYWSDITFSPSVANATPMYGIRQEISPGANVTGDTVAGYFYNTGGATGLNRLGLYCAVAGTGTLPSIDAAIYGYSAQASGTTYGGYFVSNPTSGTSYAVHADALRPASTSSTSSMYGFYTTMVWTPTASNASSLYGVEASADGNGNTNATGSMIGGRFQAYLNSGGTAYGVLGIASNSGAGSDYAGWFTGNVNITGSISKGSGTFLIDHPLDPENKILRHSFVESPEMLNVYKGRGRLENGVAVITLPTWFDALNHPDTREVNLTCKNGWSPLYLDGEIAGNQFTVRTATGGNPSQEFTWVAYGVRNDAFARAHPVVVEEEKGPSNGFHKGWSVHTPPPGDPAAGTGGN